MMEFLATNFNLSTIIVSIIVFGGTGWLLYHEHKTGGLGHQRHDAALFLYTAAHAPAPGRRR